MIERELTFETEFHSADAIQRAAYKLSDRLSSEVMSDENGFRCRLYITAATEAEAEEVVGDFRNEVLDETLRERVRNDTREVRNVILAVAFSRTGLVEAADN